ncbi:glycosyl hydrolase 115 family protein [Flavobacterium sp. MAHUQ-51]|uniref:glycosyl hydrolase 115 family protein n=1 Tax=Flavobacterium sp. GCM10022190 TaxID=3252639 RepID=UPI003620A6B4
MKKTFILMIMVATTFSLKAQSTLFKHSETTYINFDKKEKTVVKTAISLLQKDVNAIFGGKLEISDNFKSSHILIGTIGLNKDINRLAKDNKINLSTIKAQKQAFLLTVTSNGKLIIVGSDQLGTAYGIMELSRLIGISPWEWWADAIPAKKDEFKLPFGFRKMEAPKVEFRGIFINDEDWGLLPWSNQTYEPSSVKGHIGPRTHERIFELLLRLRANTYWPAMHEVTLPFFMTEGNREIADKYGIYIGSSHCEPMACNAAGEWKRRGNGDYDYVNNSSSVAKFWEDRIKEVAGQNILYTLGMRGVHDGQMQGAKTVEEQKTVLDRVFKDQRELLVKYVNKDVTKVPQVFIPYKEVLDVYNTGLQVPDDVTLMWCDDNYGYIHHFPTEKEKTRQGGNGVYYHASYWGRPHDYLWLGTAHPSLIYQQMKLAYDKGVQKIWILNVGDIKPLEYQIELFMDMAWDIDAVTNEGVIAHQRHFLEREFGMNMGKELNSVMQEYYRLAYIRKPEFMGNTREEEKDPAYKVIKDLPWSESYIHNRLNAYKKLSDKVEQLSGQIQERSNESYFQLVKYPVQAATQMNNKLLKGQLARYGKAEWTESDLAYDSIVSLTRIYNKGKWNRIMDFQPHKLPVFEKVKRELLLNPMVEERNPVITLNGVECINGKSLLLEGLGYAGKAVGVSKSTSLTYSFNDWKKNTVEIEIHLLPNHPVQGDRLRFSVSLDGGTPQTLSYETQGRSEEWKENVLRNQAIKQLKFPVSKLATHQLIITAIDEGVVIDQILLY